MSLAQVVPPAGLGLDGFSNDLIFSYIDFNRSRDPKQLDRVVKGVLQFYAKPPTGRALTSLPESTRLEQDLGCDLMTVANTICMVESLFGIELGRDEIARIETVADLCGEFRRHVFAALDPEN